MTLDYIFTTCTGHSPEYFGGKGELEFYNNYANGDDHGKGILAANWNNFPHGGREWVQGEGYPEYIMTSNGQKYNGTTWENKHRFETILEKAGYRLEWSDQTTRCDHCNGCIYTDAQHVWDTPHYAMLGSDNVCEACIKADFAEEYLESLENTNARWQGDFTVWSKVSDEEEEEVASE